MILQISWDNLLYSNERISIPTITEYRIPRNMSAQSIENELNTHNAVVGSGKHYSCLRTNPLKPHTFGHHEVVWFSKNAEHYCELTMPSSWVELLNDIALIEFLESKILQMQSQNTILRAYGHYTAHHIKIPQTSATIERAIQSIRQPHLHVSEEITNASLHQLNICTLEDDIDKYTIILNYAQELFVDILESFKCITGKRVQYIQNVGIDDSIQLTRSIYGFDSFVQCIENLAHIQEKLSLLWSLLAQHIEVKRSFNPELEAVLRLSLQPNFAFLFPSKGDRQRYSLFDHTCYLYTGTMSSPVELLTPGGAWLTRL